MVTSPWALEEMHEFLETFFYSPDAFLIRHIESANPETGEIHALCPPDTHWLVSPQQRGKKEWHPRHVSGGDLVMLTASLGSLHAFFFHGCRWKDGWVGFGSRIEKAEFHSLGKLDLPLELHSKETKLRRGSKRTMISFQFQFSQQGRLVYSSEQTALFVKSHCV